MSNVISRYLASLEEFEEAVESDESETKDEILEFTDNAAEVLEEHQEVESLDVNGNPETVQEDVLDVAPDTSDEEPPATEPTVNDEVELDNPPEEESDDSEDADADPVNDDDDTVEVSLDDDVVDTDEAIDAEVGSANDTGESDLDESEELEEADLEKGELDVPDPEETSEAEVAEAEDEADEAEEEAEEDDEEIEELEEDIEDLEEEKASVESYLTVLRHGVKTGVYSSQVVALTQEHMLGLNKRLNGHVKVASMEDFNASNLKDYYVQNIASLEAVENKLTTVLGNLGKDLMDVFTSDSRYEGYKKRVTAINKESDRLLGLVKEGGSVNNKQRLLSVPAKDLTKSIVAELATSGKFIPLVVNDGSKMIDTLIEINDDLLTVNKEAEMQKLFTKPSKLKPIQVPVVYKEPSKLDGFKVDFHDKPEDDKDIKGIVDALMPVGSYNKTTATGDTLELTAEELKSLLTLSKALVALVGKTNEELSSKLKAANRSAERIRKKAELERALKWDGVGGRENSKMLQKLALSVTWQYRNTRNLFDVLVKRNFALAEAINSLVKQTVK